MKKLILIAALAATIVAQADDTDCGALITTSSIEGTAKVENLTGGNAGKATITINNNSGTANSVTVYNAATVDSALSGKASTGDVTALQNRATALETATNNLTSAVGSALADAKAYTDEQCGVIQDGLTPRLFNIITSIKDAATSATNYTDSAYANATNNAVQTCVKKSGDTMTGSLIMDAPIIFNGTTGAQFSDTSLLVMGTGGGVVRVLPYTDIALNSELPSYWPYTAITNAPWLTSYTETDPTVPSWAKASSKPSYNFSEIGSKPTTISGYGITDAKIANGVITLGANTITPVTTETDPVWSSEKSGYVPTSRKVAGMALSSDITLKNLSIVGSSTTTYNGSGTASVNQTTQTQTSTTQSGTTGKNLTIQVAATSLDMGAYYIKIGSDGKPHLMLRQ